jgi:hypothetical protein
MLNMAGYSIPVPELNNSNGRISRNTQKTLKNWLNSLEKLMCHFFVHNFDSVGGAGPSFISDSNPTLDKSG